VYVEHQFGDLIESPQMTAADAAGLQLVDLAVVEERDFVQWLAHASIIRVCDCMTTG
jgi:hypothetical protein